MFMHPTDGRFYILTPVCAANEGKSATPASLHINLIFTPLNQYKVGATVAIQAGYLWQHRDLSIC